MGMSRSGDVNTPTREFPEYPDGTPEQAGPVEPATPPAESGGRRRGLLGLAAIVGLVAVVLLSTQAVGLLPNWRNPFAQQETDRTQPPVLQSIQDLSRFVAAEGNYQVVVDLEQDRRYVPDFLLNERTLFVGVGTVEAYVDFGQIGEEAISTSEDGLSAQIELPAPQLTDADLDLDNSYVFAEERGLLNRLGEVFGGDPNRRQQVYQLAEDRITAAARESGIAGRAEENTRKMLTGLLRSLGYEEISVTFVTP